MPIPPNQQSDDLFWRLGEIAIGIIAALLGLLWKTKPSTAKVQTMIDAKLEAHRVADIESDHLLLAPLATEQKNLRDEVMRMHGENRTSLGEANAKLDRLIERGFSHERGH